MGTGTEARKHGSIFRQQGSYPGSALEVRGGKSMAGRAGKKQGCGSRVKLSSTRGHSPLLEEGSCGPASSLSLC